MVIFVIVKSKIKVIKNFKAIGGVSFLDVNPNNSVDKLSSALSTFKH